MIGAPLVLDEAVAVPIAVPVDPVEGGERVRPEPVHELAVARPVVDLAEEDEPQRRGVDAAVVRAVRQLLRRRHLADAQLVQDLARLRVPPLVELGRLARRQHGQRLHAELRAERDRLERRDQRIPPEQRAEPRHAGGEIALALARRLVDQQPEVGHGARHREVEQLVVGVHLGRAPRPGVVRAAWLALVDPGRFREQLGRTVARVRGVGHGRPHDPAQLPPLAGGEGPGPAEAQPGPGLRIRPAGASTGSISSAGPLKRRCVERRRPSRPS